VRLVSVIQVVGRSNITYSSTKRPNISRRSPSEFKHSLGTPKNGSSYMRSKFSNLKIVLGVNSTNIPTVCQLYISKAKRAFAMVNEYIVRFDIYLK